MGWDLIDAILGTLIVVGNRVMGGRGLSERRARVEAGSPVRVFQ